MTRALRRPGMSRLALAGLLGETGDWMLFIALPLYVLSRTGSGLVTSTVFALELAPTVLLGPLGGALADRTDPWRLMCGAGVLQALCLLPLLAADATGLWLVYVVVAVQATLAAVVEPARGVTAAALAGPGELAGANQALGLLSSVARLAGGPLGGVVLSTGGLRAVVLADAGSFAAVAGLMALGGARVPRGARPDGRGWRAGARATARTPTLRRTVPVVACMGVAQGAFVVLFVLFVTRDLHGSDGDVGLLRGVQAIGGLAGGALLGLVVARVAAPRLLALSLVAFGALSLMAWNLPLLTTGLAPYVALFVAVGVPGVAGLTGLMTLLQTAAGDAVRGAVLGTFLALYGAAQALGMLLAGVAGTGTGLDVALELQGLLYLVAAALALRLPWGAGVPGDPQRPRRHARGLARVGHARVGVVGAAPRDR